MAVWIAQSFTVSDILVHSGSAGLINTRVSRFEFAKNKLGRDGINSGK